MSAADDAISEELRSAFPATRAARFSTLVNSVQGDEPLQVEADFADKDDWTKLLPEWLDTVPNGLSSALSFLSDEAIRFYIPAYLVADLKGALFQVDPTFCLVRGFDDMSRDLRIWPRKAETWTDFARSRWDGLNQQQAMAIVHYLEWRIVRDGVDTAHDVNEALTAYWYMRAARPE
jgi:hypothetical protein